MKFCILCTGTQGDILPYIALGIGLKSKDHEICIASYSKASTLCEQYGLNFACIEGDVTELISAEKGQELFFNKKRSQLFLIKEFLKEIQKVVDVQLMTSLKAVEDADVLIFNPGAFAGPHLGEYLQIPSFRVSPSINVRSSQYPSYFFSKMNQFGAFGCLTSHFIHEQLFWQPVRKQINTWREKVLKIRKMHFLGPYCDKISQKIPTILTINPALMPSRLKESTNLSITNFCRVIDKESWAPPKSLVEFLKDKVDIYLSFGSPTRGCPPPIAKDIVDVLIKNKIRAIINADLPGIEASALPSSIYPLNYVPYHWLLPQVENIIHHGGIGTIAEGLYAGLPTLVMPFYSDQFFWGERIEKLNLGPKPLPIKFFKREVFESRLNELLINPSFKQNAKKMKGELEKFPNGVEMTMDIIFKYLKQTT